MKTLKCLVVDNEIKLYEKFEAENLEEAFKKALGIFGYKIELHPEFKSLGSKTDSNWYQFDSLQLRIEKLETKND